MNRLILTFLMVAMCMADAAEARTRVYVLTDISTLVAEKGEPDDTQSMIRLLMYADELEITGLGATFSSYRNRVYPELLRHIVRMYGESHDALSRYGSYPDVATLLERIHAGSPRRGAKYIGEGNDSGLSDDLVRAISTGGDSPLWILVWGAPLDLAQALWRMEQTMSRDSIGRILENVRVYAIDDQYDLSGPWIRGRYPALTYITNYCSFRGMYRTGDETLASAQWVESNIKTIDAPLARLYPVYKGGDPWGKVAGMKEGDTPSLLFLLDESPGCLEDPTRQGWGGRFTRIPGTNHYFDAPKTDMGRAAKNISKYRKQFQRSFARRLRRLAR